MLQIIKGSKNIVNGGDANDKNAFTKTYGS